MSKPTILVINHFKARRQSVVELLTLSGYNVLVAENGKIGLEILTKHNLDLILCNAEMPGLDGFALLRAIHNIPNMINIPFIFLGSKSDVKAIRKGMNLGADDFMVKPTDEDLLEVINIQLKKSGRAKQQFQKENKKAGAALNTYSTFLEIFSSSPYKANKKVKPKQAIYMEGDSVNFIFYLVKGKVKTFRVNEEGKEIITALYREGDIFGHTSFFEKIQKDSCTAMEQSELVYLPKDEFLEILRAESDIALDFIKMILDYLLESGDRLLKLAYNSSSKKIAQALVFYSKIYQDGREDFPFDRRDISTIAGVAKESVSRKISYFNNKGLIKINPKNGNIKIIDSGKLDKLKS
jgi:CRP-like cAMP-binding protein/CheY-like chemotaxis protein